MLSKANKVIKKVRISEGGVSGTVVDPKKIYKIALDHHASSLIKAITILQGISSRAKQIRRSLKRSKKAAFYWISLFWIT
jgi:DNA repair protein RadC